MRGNCNRKLFHLNFNLHDDGTQSVTRSGTPTLPLFNPRIESMSKVFQPFCLLYILYVSVQQDVRGPFLLRITVPLLSPR